MTVIRTPLQQTGTIGKTILRTPLVVQQGIYTTLNLALNYNTVQLYENPQHVNLVTSFSFTDQGGQQVVTQIIQGQAVSTPMSGASPVATVTGQGMSSPSTAEQAASQIAASAPRVQGQNQVKLTLAQLTHLTQVGKHTRALVIQYISNTI